MPRYPSSTKQAPAEVSVARADTIHHLDEESLLTMLQLAGGTAFVQAERLRERTSQRDHAKQPHAGTCSNLGQKVDSLG